MKTRLLLFLSFLMITALTFVNAQTGTVNIVSIPATIEAGTSGAIEVTYTSDIACKLNITLRETKPNETSADWDSWNGQMDVAGLVATSTPTTVTFNYNIAGGQTPSSGLASGVQYTFAFKLVGDNAEGNFGFNDGQAANLVEITAPSSVVNSVNFTSVPTTIAAGDDLLANFEYTLVNEGKVKVDVRKYDGDTYINNASALVAEAFINPAAATTITPVADSKTLTIDESTPISSSLSGNENYKLVVGIYDSAWKSIMEVKRDLTITASLGIDDAKEDGFAFYPNPVEDVLMIKSNKLFAKTINIIDMTGRTIRVINNAENLKSIDVSDFKNGLYILNIDNKKQYKFLKK